MSSFDSQYSTLKSLSNSTSKLQDFFGVDDIEELKTNQTLQKRNSAPIPCKLKTISNEPKQTKRLKRKSKRISRGLNKLRSKLTNTKSLNDKINTNTKTVNPKVLWRPSLKIILNDNVLLNSLIQFMEMSYNSENILFLQEVIELNKCNITNINPKILLIYSKFIEPFSEYQINLSYGCLLNIMDQKSKFINYEIENKKTMFNLCVEEINRLISTSVLNSFYMSSYFQLNASKSKYFPHGI